MKQQDYQDFRTLWCSVAENYSSSVVSDCAVSLAFQALLDLDLSDIRKALLEHVRTSAFAPKPVDILTIVRKNSADTSAAQEWVLVMWAIDAFGPKSVCFQNVRTAVTVNKMGGYHFLLNSLTEKNEDFYRKEFIETYEDTGIRNYPAEMRYCGTGTELQYINTPSDYMPAWVWYVSSRRNTDAHIHISELLSQLDKGTDKLPLPCCGHYVSLTCDASYYRSITPGLITGTRDEAEAHPEQVVGKLKDGGWLLKPGRAKDSLDIDSALADLFKKGVPELQPA